VDVLPRRMPIWGRLVYRRNLSERQRTEGCCSQTVHGFPGAFTSVPITRTQYRKPRKYRAHSTKYNKINVPACS